MAQCGLHIPCDDGSAVCIVFDSVLADIGDEQSIEQTSVHLLGAYEQHRRRSWTRRTSTRLVLFDELGAGTDPAEGAALAIADHRAGCVHRVRKHRCDDALRRAQDLRHDDRGRGKRQRASSTWRRSGPTYRLLIGMPGKSNAFAISKRLGLSEAVIEKAKAQMDSESIHLEDVLTQLEREEAAVRERKSRGRPPLRPARGGRAQGARIPHADGARKGEREKSRRSRGASAFWLRPSPSRTTRSASSTQLRKQQKKLDAQQMNAPARRDHAQRSSRRATLRACATRARSPSPSPRARFRSAIWSRSPSTRRQAEVTAVKDGTLTLQARAFCR